MLHKFTFACLSLSLALSPTAANAAGSSEPIADGSLVFAEKEGLVAVEAEHFIEQSQADKRAFYLTTADDKPAVEPDGDPAHVAGASGGAYLEVLPDTRRTHDDKLIRGTNFAPDAGRMAVLSYKVHITTPGRYYVWVRAFSTGSEDNGLHVGLDGEWPASGQRLQWCEGKRTWRWDSKQRTEKEHCGEPYKIFLDIKEPGEHTIHFSMREDGFEFDKWLMTTNRDFERPDGVGPASEVHAGTPPKAFRLVKAQKKFPAHWGEPPKIQTRDLVPLPGGYGRGSSTLRNWIQQNLDADARVPQAKQLTMPAAEWSLDGTGFYLDRGKWAAINPDQRKKAVAENTFPFPTGVYNVTLQAVGENDGESTYVVSADGEAIGDFKCPLSGQTYEEDDKFHKTWNKVQLTEGTVIKVAAEVGSKDGQEFSRARWAAVTFEPANDATRKAAAPLLKKMAQTSQQAPRKAKPKGSPTIPVSKLPLIMPRQPDGDGSVKITGELKQWHKVTLTLDGPYAHEQDNDPNPFTDYFFAVEFTHESGTPKYLVPGYFAADGDAANTSAEAGTKWRAHLSPDLAGAWKYRVVGPIRIKDLHIPNDVADAPREYKRGSFEIAATDKSGRDLRAHGRLQYVGKHYLQFAGSKKYFLKAGADAPETLLGYVDFDNTIAGKPDKVPLKTWGPHVQDWNDGDPTWKDGKGKGLIGAVNYLSGKGCNAFSFLTYNAGGDGDNVWPYIHRDDKLHFDCSKLDQWGIVFDHATAKGMYLHFKMQETENDDHKRGHNGGKGNVPESLDGGDFGLQRRAYCGQLIARYGHNLALNWNLGEENTQTTEQQKQMIHFLATADPYKHNIVIHTFPNEQDKVYKPLLGDRSELTGVSLQNSGIKDTHSQTVKWVTESAKAGKPWIVAFDESGTAAHGQCPDLGYKGFDGKDRTGKMIYTEHEVRHQTLWGTLMGGGAGVEYYFGYQFVENDLVCEDWRSRDRSWDYCRVAINFFHDQKIPFHDMQPADELVGNAGHDNSKYCFAKSGEVYVVYLPKGGTTDLDLTSASGTFTVKWFDPRNGGELLNGSVASIEGGKVRSIGQHDGDGDRVALVRRSND
ncbi:DUF5060 domain-containing protein [Fuerstiella marisgermanici]|uniref:DUF5060 domain-containing protein n=1 Tax=Fuerstiella marisgermanici TaxID=1891926 RepID=A0A1P8WK73_9PLAN|nr:DUF5060 domain-containing protein [Fuerstiella marisgermanici]APZ94436.1 hypothetical protein Fuma_04068 [Fuerstiella marisgermanici]